ncbi:hypothetical protein CAOG_05427 [Capsaspora owczarzaki ATCC 30864]|uniref:hypothetical protein n=1 Tax=Capsaspora owczarzaki (strain ATCC 30864) TaxID=595528 RepID=UPI0001FE5E94|nr:hypothetical protein CAOG_05427 [Capsaspora owczarzaki ATCC 30864]|eukprot:XP_004346100.1 hypothetical protein CAOG_05427 [Capsaspora owczarzaki ATCC 30864]
MAVPTAAATTSAVSAAVTATAPVIVQYIAIRRDLLKTLKWTFGSVATQACHASSAAIWTFRKHPCTEEYLSDEQIDRMHKVVVEVADEAALWQLGDQLKEKNIDHKLWLEQPEAIPTAIATRPYVKSEIQDVFRPFKLFR